MHRSNVYRAVVQEANATTGRIAVTIPGIAGASSRFQVTALGRDDVEGTWKVPPVGSVVLVAAEDEDLTTLFLVQTYTYDSVVRATDLYGDLHGPVVVLGRSIENVTIPAGTVVYDTAIDQDLAIGVANANDPGAMPALGIAVEDIAPGDKGKVAVSGYLSPFDTTGLTVGIDIYAGEDGTLSNTPVGLTVQQIVAKVVEDGVAGSLMVNVYPPTGTWGSSTGSYNGVFNGTVYASAGVIGGASLGWVIQPNRLESYGSGDKIVLDGSQGEIYIGEYGNGTFASTSTPFYVNKDGQFSLGDKLTWDGSTLDIDGTITANDGEIGGWTIGPTSLTGSSVGLAPGSYPIYAGSNTASVAPFRVSNSGAVTASNATITGAITATSGSIGNWAISGGTTLQSSGASPIVLDSGNGKMYVGNSNWGNSGNGFYADATGKFGLGSNFTWNPAVTTGASSGVLTLNGYINAGTANLAGWTLQTNRLYAGTAGDYIELNTDPLQEYRTWAGHPTAASAAFRVKKDGTLYASNAFITGTITGSSISGGSISGNLITGGSLVSGFISGGSVTSGLITGGSISGASISATQGQIGGWTLGTNTLSGTNTSLNSNGTITVGTGSSTAGLSASDPSIRLWAGATNPSAAPFRVTAQGYMTAASSTVNVYSENVIYGKMSVAAPGGNMALGASVSPGNNNGLYIGQHNYWYDTGDFKVGNASNYVQWNGSTLGVVGNITATSGSFNGAVNASAGSFSGTVYASAGSFAGTVYASGGSFSGLLSATSGSIGGWTLSNSATTSGSISYPGLTSGNTIIAGGTSPIKLQSGTGASVFKVFDNGTVSAPCFILRNSTSYDSAVFGPSRSTLTTDVVLETGASIVGSVVPQAGLYEYDSIALNTSSGEGGGLFWGERAVSASAYLPSVQVRGPYYYNTPESIRPRIQMEANSTNASSTSLGLIASKVYISGSGLYIEGGGSDVSGSSLRTGRLVIGTDTKTIGIDENELQSRTAASVGGAVSPSTLILNKEGGDVTIGPASNSPATAITLRGDVTIQSSGSFTVNGPTTLGAATFGNITAGTISGTTITGSGAISGTTISLTNASANGLITADLATASTTQTAVAINSSHQFRRQSSSQAFKTNIIPLTDSPLVGVSTDKIIDPATDNCCTSETYADTVVEDVLSITPVLFESIIEDETGIPTLGFIAEDVHQKFPLAATTSSDGSPSSWSAAPVVAALVAVVKDLKHRIEELEGDS